MTECPAAFTEALATLEYTASHLPDHITTADFLKQELDPVVPIIEDLIDKETIVMIVGKSKIGKSQFALQLGLHCAAGIKFGSFKPSAPLRVLYVNSELRPQKIRIRIKEILDSSEFMLGDLTTETRTVEESLHKAKQNFAVLNLRGYFPKDEKELATHIAYLAKKHRADIIVIDPLYLLIEGNENESHIAKETCKLMSYMVAETKACLMYVHHDKKGQAGDTRLEDRGSGSGLFQRYYDAALVISEHSRDTTIVVVEGVNRDYAKLEPFCLERRGRLFIVSKAEPTKRTNQTDKKQRLTTIQLEQYVNGAIVLINESLNNGGSLSTADLRTLIMGTYDLSTNQAKQVSSLVDQKIKKQGEELGIRKVKVGHQRFEYVESDSKIGSVCDTL